MDQSTSAFIDASRWFAAFLVVISHLRSLMFVDFPQVAAPTPFLQALYFGCGFGPIAVIVFFVISGYLVGGRMVLRARVQRASLLDYGSHRIARIYTVLLPALLTGYAFDLIGSHFADQSGIYAGSIGPHMMSFAYNVGARLDLRTLLGNTVMLQTILVQPLGSNGPLWSLANEWWYYVIFGLLLAAAPQRPLTLRLVAAAAALLTLVALPIAISLWFAIWGIGVGVALVEQRWRAPNPAVALAILALVFAFVRLRHGTGDAAGQGRLSLKFLSDLAVALAYGWALLSAKRLPQSRIRSLHARLAAFSYSTYLVHFPMMLLLLAAAHRILGVDFAAQPHARALATAACLLALAYLYSWIFSRLTEKHTEPVSRALMQLGHRVRPAAISANAAITVGDGKPASPV